MRKADEKRRLAKEQKERREMQESREGEVAGVYDDDLARQNRDGLHGLGLHITPTSYPDRYDDEIEHEAQFDYSALSSAFTFSMNAAPTASPTPKSSSTAAATSVAVCGDENAVASTSKTVHALASNVATRAREEVETEAKNVDADEANGLSASWEDVSQDQE
ncbi:hypothetical protein FRC17_005189 [Serendipita sp. 399]|nr:hypothetical protein FRC17_005189 [Serendipita sp. 399]